MNWLTDAMTNQCHEFEIVSKCPFQDCGKLFISRYNHFSEKKGYVNGYYSLIESQPYGSKTPDFQKQISDLSPLYCEIYTQAIHAETIGLDQIAGVGYRKAIEHLIKDFCILEYPDDETKILKMPLMKCIKEYITDKNILECSKRAVWLGNDETHYERRWLNKDINDMKALINLMVHWISNLLLTKHYLSQMPEN